MPSHDPLTNSQIDLPSRIGQRPIELTTAETGKDWQHLVQTGYLEVLRIHIAQEHADRVWRYSRSNKPYP